MNPKSTTWGVLLCLSAAMAGCAGNGDAPIKADTDGIQLKPTETIAQPPSGPIKAIPTDAALASAPPPVAEVVPKPSVPVAPADRSAAAPKEPAPKPVAAAPVPAKPGPPTLDLKALEKRLKDTGAIGVFTKLTLKNQVDDLLVQVKGMHQGKPNPTSAQIRQSYDLLIMKVVSLLQDGDPPLARDVVVSREPLWGILSDPVKFASIN